MSCKLCGLPTANEPYREPAFKAVEPMEPPMSFFDRVIKNSKAWAMAKRGGAHGLDFAIGLVWFLAILAGGWCAFPGAYKLGRFVANDLLYWGLSTNWNGDNPPICMWLLGFGLILSLPLAFVMGRATRHHYLEKKGYR